MSEQPLIQTITLTLPIDYQIPAVYRKGTPEAIAAALTSGAETTALWKEELQVKVRNETHQEIIQQVKKRTHEDLEAVNDQLPQTKKRLCSLEKDAHDQEQWIRDDERTNREDIIRENDAPIKMLEDHWPKFTDAFQHLRQIPAVYLEGTPEEIAVALTFGAQATAVLTKELQTKVRNETHKQIIQEAMKSKEDELEAINDQLLQTTKQLRSQEKYVLDQEEHIRDCERRNREDIIRVKDEHIQMLEQDLPKLTEGFKQLQELVIRNTKISTSRGKYGEVQVEELLKKAFGSASSFDLNRVGKEGHRGDFLMNYAGATFLWEVKNHTNKVPKTEVSKLKNDMGANPIAAMGIMISLQSGIVGHENEADIDIEYIQDNRSILYISNFHQRQDMIFYLQSLRPLFEVAAVIATAVVAAAVDMTGNNTELHALRKRAKDIQSLLATHLKRVEQQHTSLKNHKKRTEEMFSDFQSFINEIRTSEGHVKQMLHAILGDAGACSAAAPLEFIF